MMSRPRPSNWLVRLLSIKGLVSLAVEQDFSLTQGRLASRKNFRSMSNLTEANGIPNSIEEDFGRNAPDQVSSSGLQFPEMLLCPGTHFSETLEKRLERRSILELFTKYDRDLIVARLSEKTET